MKDGVIAQIRINDGVSLTLEYEGDLVTLFQRVDDIFVSYQKVIDHRYPYVSLWKRIWKRLKP